MNKLKNKTGYSLAVFVVLVGAVQSARAEEVVTNNFTGTITSVSGTLFRLSPSPSSGQQVQGSFTYDTSQSPAFDTGTVAGYIQSLPSGMSVVISGVTLQSQSYNSFQVINNGFGVDNINGFFTPISVGGVPRSDRSSISFSLNDFTQTALSSTALPTSLNFSSFSQRTGSIFDAASGGVVNFSIDPPAITVKIDIEPGSFPNSINLKSAGRIPVAILTTGPSDNVPTFDATTVNPATVRFGSRGTEAAPVHDALEDVDGDGDTDLILHFNTQNTGIKCGDPSATLTGETLNGQKFTGTDSIKTVGCK